jgi:hypothetical protein
MSAVTVPTYASFSLTAMQHNITLADTKAGYLLAGSIAFLTFMAKEAFQGGPTPDYLAILAGAAFLATAGFAAATFRPRQGSAPANSLSYWRSPIYAGDETTVADHLSGSELVSTVDQAVAAHLWALANVCRRKFATLRVAFIFGCVAIISFLAWRILQAT